MAQPIVFFSASEKFPRPTYVCGSWANVKHGSKALAIFNNCNVAVDACTVSDEKRHTLPMLLKRMTELKHKNIAWPFAWQDFGHTLHVIEQGFVPLDLQTAPATSLHQIASGLLFLHDSGITHGELSLSCLATSAGGRRVKITGCGIACIRSTILPHATLSSDSLFRAPEQAGGLPAGPPADVYAFGTIASCFARPFNADYFNLCDHFLQFIIACAHKDAEKRPTMQEIVANIKSNPSDFIVN